MPLRDHLRAARALAAGTAIAAGSLMSMAPPAGAGVDTAKEVAPMTIAPACVRGSERTDFWHKYADIHNGCSRTFRVRAIIAFAWDSPCVTLDSGEGFTHTYNSSAGRLDRIDLC